MREKVELQYPTEGRKVDAEILLDLVAVKVAIQAIILTRKRAIRVAIGNALS